MMLKILDRYMFYKMPGYPRLLIWRDWLRTHGVDPNDVVIPGWIERREHDRQLVWLACRCGRCYTHVHDGEPDSWWVERVMQLESPPLPWPEMPWPP